MSDHPPNGSPIRQIAVALLLIALLGGGGYALWRYLPDNSAATDGPAATFTVERQDMLVSITEGGTLQALDEKVINNEVQGQSRVTFLIPEGTVVETGELLLELDSSQLSDKLNSQQIDVQKAVAAASSAEEQMAIKKSQNESNIREAELKVNFAELDLEKYRDGDYPQAKRKAEADITIAEAELTRARDKLAWTEKLQEKGYATRSELEADRLSVKRTELDVQNARHKLEVLQKYEYPQQVAKLEAEVTKAAEELDRVRRRAAAELSQATADLESKKAQLELQESKLQNLIDELAKTRIVAPQPGLVVYNTGAGGNRRRRSDDFLEVGAMVNYRQEMLKLPDLSSMKLEIKIHEARIGQVEVGMPVAVTIDTLPDRVFQGRVDKVAVLPDAQSSWLNPDLKVYSTTVLIEEDLPATIKPGVSAKAQVVIATLEKVLVVPVQAVATLEGNQYCFVVQPDGSTAAQPVQIGMYNESRIEILAGLEEGQVVDLDPPLSPDAIRKHVELVPAEEIERIQNAPARERPTAAAPSGMRRDQATELPKTKTESSSTEASEPPADILEKVAADKREKFAERWRSSDEEQRKQMAQRIRDGGGKPSQDGS